MVTLELSHWGSANVRGNMRREDAVKKLGKLLGKNLGYRVDPRAPDADERQEAMAELKLVGANRDDLQARMQVRRRAILEADAEYQLLQGGYLEAKKYAESLASKSHHYRFTAGVSNGIFFMVKAQGDSWEEVIAKIEKDKRPVTST